MPSPVSCAQENISTSIRRDLRLITQTSAWVDKLRTNQSQPSLQYMNERRGPIRRRRQASQLIRRGRRFVPDFAGRGATPHDRYHYLHGRRAHDPRPRLLAHIENGSLKETILCRDVVHKILARARVLYSPRSCCTTSPMAAARSPVLGADIAMYLGPRMAFAAAETRPCLAVALSPRKSTPPSSAT